MTRVGFVCVQFRWHYGQLEKRNWTMLEWDLKSVPRNGDFVNNFVSLTLLDSYCTNIAWFVLDLASLMDIE